AGGTGAARHARRRPAGGLCASPVAALPGLPRGTDDVRRPLVVLAPSPAALRGRGAVRAALRRLPLPGRVRARARRPHRLPRLRLGDDGPGAEHAADPAGSVVAVAVARPAGPAAPAAPRPPTPARPAPPATPRIRLP